MSQLVTALLYVVGIGGMFLLLIAPHEAGHFLGFSGPPERHLRVEPLGVRFDLFHEFEEGFGRGAGDERGVMVIGIDGVYGK